MSSSHLYHDYHTGRRRALRTAAAPTPPCDGLRSRTCASLRLPHRRARTHPQGRHMEQSEGQVEVSKRQERLAFLLLTAVIFPLMAVLIVAGYGFLVWMWQLLFAGPPTGP